jgi:hypothetical protein
MLLSTDNVTDRSKSEFGEWELPLQPSWPTWKVVFTIASFPFYGCPRPMPWSKFFIRVPKWGLPKNITPNDPTDTTKSVIEIVRYDMVT